MKSIMLISPQLLPVPATRGGAIEQLMTDILEENEKYRQARFVVVSKPDAEAERIKYGFSNVYYIDSENRTCRGIHSIRFFWVLYRIWLKLFRNHWVVKVFPEKHLRMSFFEFCCLIIAKKEKVDVVVLEGYSNEVRFERFNDVVGKENLYTHLHYRRIEEFDERKAVNNSISISNYIREQWIKNRDIEGKNCVLYNCAHVERFSISVSKKDRQKKRNELGVSDKDFLVLYCGRIIPSKGIMQLLEAIESLGDKSIKLLMIGSAFFGGEGISDFELEVNEKAERMQSVIRRGYIPNSELPQWYALADIQVIPSICQEGAGIVAIEGMAAGLPLITTQSGGMVEYVNDDTAIQLPIDDHLASNLAKEILRLREDDELRARMGSAGRERAKCFSKEKYYEEYISIF